MKKRRRDIPTDEQLAKNEVPRTRDNVHRMDCPEDYGLEEPKTCVLNDCTADCKQCWDEEVEVDEGK